jgi:hypothetical protein
MLFGIFCIVDKSVKLALNDVLNLIDSFCKK